MKKFFSIFILCFMVMCSLTGCSFYDDIRKIVEDEVKKQLTELEQIEDRITSVEIIGNKSFALNSEFDATKIKVRITLDDESTDEVALLESFDIVDYPDMTQLGLSKFVAKLFKRKFDLYIYIVNPEDIPAEELPAPNPPEQ